MGERKAEDAVAVVRSVLGELAASVARRDVDAIVASFEVGGVLLGTAATSVGVDAIRAYVETVVAPPKKLAWEWDLDALVAESEQDAIWFFAPGVAVMTDPDAGVVERAPMRLSGVLRRGGDGAWRWAQFHGSVADPR